MPNTTATRDPALVLFGSEVRAAREKAGRRASEFADEIAISLAHLDRIESGRGRASNAVYWRIANALQLDPTPVLREAVAS